MPLPFLLASLLATGIQSPIAYPVTRQGDVVETLHGVRVPDPYRWLEDANSKETKAWVQAQNKLSRSYLAAIPERKLITAQLTKIWNFERFGAPERAGKYYFYTRNNGLQNQSVVYVTTNLRENGRVLLDPNRLSKDGTAALNGRSFTQEGSLMAYAVSKGGSDWLEWHVRDVATGKDLPDVIKWSKFSGASWTKGGRGFFYSAYAAPKPGKALQDANYNQKLYYHRLGTPQSKDELIYQRPDHKEWGFDGTETEDGRYLIITIWNGTARENRVLVKDLRFKNAKVQDLLVKNDAKYAFIGNDGTSLMFWTDKNAPTGKVIAVDVNNPRPARWKTIIPAVKESLDTAVMAGNSLVTVRLKDVTSQVQQWDLTGRPIRSIRLPGLGQAIIQGAHRRDPSLFYTYTSYTTPWTAYELNLKSGKSTAFRTPKVAFESAKYETKEVFYTSKDGTRIPLFITAKKGTKLDGQNPTLLYGYGGFNVSLLPEFSAPYAQWLNMGGVYAVACIRGGGEYGKAWHDGGRLHNKQNCYDDFIAAGEYLIQQGYTSTPKLACEGASNGGLLIGAVVNQRPDLWGAALPEVGVMDLLRFHKFTIGWGWVSDFGSPDKAEDFPYIYKISPLHNIKPGTSYPPVLVTTGDHDDRVVPAHSFKYTAALQAAQAGPAPVLIRIETSAGHGGGKPTSKQIEEIADEWSFLVKSLGMTIRK